MVFIRAKKVLLPKNQSIKIILNIVNEINISNKPFQSAMAMKLIKGPKHLDPKK